MPGFDKNMEMLASRKTTKEQIIGILTYEWPLSIRKIFFLLKKKHQRKFTYQAVYKAINQMKEDKILEETKEGFRLNLEWVKEIHNETEIIRVNYFSEQRASIFERDAESSEIRVFIFKNWFDVEKYLYYFQKSCLSRTNEKKEICFHHAHEWRPIFYLRAEYNWITQMMKKGHKFYTLCSGNSEIDRWSASFYKSMGLKIKLNEKSAESSELLSFSDYAIQIYLPLELKQALDSEFKKAKEIKDLDLKKLIKEIFEKPSEIKVIINKDKKLSSEIQKQIISKFK